MLTRARFAAAAAVALLSLTLYRATLLPGFDFGDTGSFQTLVGTPYITPRDAYPLYFAVGHLFVFAVGGDPAAALNLASAVEAAAACGLIVIVAAELAGSLVAGVAAALLFAASYTFWSQAIIAEVYALHILLVTLTLCLLLSWARHPTTGRLCVFFFVYAIAFGNHLSMVLLLPAYTVFLLTAAPGGWRSLVRPTIVLAAVACAIAGAFQYAWNLRTLWLLPDPPAGFSEALHRFWFDVTKVDWRETTVFDVPRVMLGDRISMYLFDIRQQFGSSGAVLGLVGILALARRSWQAAALLFLVYGANVLFAFGYNVGDTHVFYLPSHLAIALAAGVAVATVDRMILGRELAAVLLAVYAAVRMYGDYPALDRHFDRRPEEVIAGLTHDLRDDRDVLLTDLNWQIDNGLAYYGQSIRPNLLYARMSEIRPHVQPLVADNLAKGRAVYVTERARTEFDGSGHRDERAPTPALADAADGLTPGSGYVLCILKPSREQTLDWTDIGRLLVALTGRAVRVPDGDYVALAGVVGQPPVLETGANRPFTRELSVGSTRVVVRMESWLATDTIRRMGFGQVVANHRHALIVERGVSFAAFDANGEATRTMYAANLFAAQPRYVIYR